MFTTEPGTPTLSEAWGRMEEIQAEGLAKSIGVSNYRIQDLQETLTSAKVKPAINQSVNISNVQRGGIWSNNKVLSRHRIEFHPYVWKESEPLLKFMEQNGIALAVSDYSHQDPILR